VPRFRSSSQSASTSFRPWKNKTGLLYNTPRNNLQTLLHDKGEYMPCAKAKIWRWIIKCFSSQSSPFHGLHNAACSGSIRSSSETRVIAGLVSCAFVTAILRHTLVCIKNDEKLRHYTHTCTHIIYIYIYIYIYTHTYIHTYIQHTCNSFYTSLFILSTLVKPSVFHRTLHFINLYFNGVGPRHQPGFITKQKYRTDHNSAKRTSSMSPYLTL